MFNHCPHGDSGVCEPDVSCTHRWEKTWFITIITFFICIMTLGVLYYTVFTPLIFSTIPENKHYNSHSQMMWVASFVWPWVLRVGEVSLVFVCPMLSTGLHPKGLHQPSCGQKWKNEQKNESMQVHGGPRSRTQVTRCPGQCSRDQWKGPSFDWIYLNTYQVQGVLLGTQNVEMQAWLPKVYAFSRESDRWNTESIILSHEKYSPSSEWEEGGGDDNPLPSHSLPRLG